MKPSAATSARWVLALVAAGILGGASASYFQGAHAHAATSAETGLAAAPDFARVTQRYAAAVVNISVSGARPQSDESDDEPAAIRRQAPTPPLLKRSQGRGRGERELPVQSEGSGFIVAADGLILTNAHVVLGAQQVTVKLTDRREYRARVLGADALTDVAVLKIDARDLPVVRLGRARELHVGEWVLAIGSPFGFEDSATAGIVSATRRTLPGDGFVPFVQTDAPVNPGNSGGPLFNARGEVVGINSQIFSRTGGYEGLSFAIPIELAVRIKDQIVATGRVSHARLGVAVQDVDQAIAESFRLDRPEGALVSSVDPGGPAADAGLRPGDVILALDGKSIVDSGRLPELIGQADPLQTVTLALWREGRREALRVKLADAQAPTSQTVGATPARGDDTLGIAVRALTQGEMHEAGADHGVLVEDASGPAALAGVQPGDVLLAVNARAVHSADEVRAAVAGSPKSLALLIERNGSTMFVPVRLA